MSLIERSVDDWIDEQRERLNREIEHWHDFRRDNPDGVYYAFSEQHRDGNIYRPGNHLKDEHAENVRDSLNLPHVAEIDGIYVDLNALQIPYNCMWKSCRLTGKWCCKVTSCTANTEFSEDVMREASQFFIDSYESETRKKHIRQGDTHTPKLSHNKRVDGHCVMGEERTDTDPDTGEEHPHIHCVLHEEAYKRDLPMHLFHSIGPSLFPADILIVDGQWYVTAASEPAKENCTTRWYVTSPETICTNHGDVKSFGILQHPDFDSLYRDVLGENVVDSIQEEAYGSTGPVEPELQDGWIRAEERGLDPYTEECRNCDGLGCEKCDYRGFFKNWEQNGSACGSTHST